MRLTVRILGTEILHICTDHQCDVPDADAAELAGGTTASTPVGFTPSPIDQRWVEAPTPTFED